MKDHTRPPAGKPTEPSAGSTALKGSAFAIALTLLIVEIKVPGSPEGPHGYDDLAAAMVEQWREYLALVLCYIVIGAHWLQHHYSGRIYARTDHWFRAINLVFLLAIVVIPYPIRVWCFHLGTGFETVASLTLVAGLAVTACTWMAKWFYGMPGRRVMDERLMTGTTMAEPPKVTSLMTKDLPEQPGKEALMTLVEHAPGRSSPVHRHTAR